MTPYQLSHEITDLQECITQATDYATGVLRADLRQLLVEYANSDFIIFRCHCTPLISLHYNLARHITPYCQTCNTEHYRLLADGTWQGETERQSENNKAYQRSLK